MGDEGESAGDSEPRSKPGNAGISACLGILSSDDPTASVSSKACVVVDEDHPSPGDMGWGTG